jgi:hypothetical protein
VCSGQYDLMSLAVNMQNLSTVYQLTNLSFMVGDSVNSSSAK